MTRTDVINFLIEKYNYKSYLEIGIQYPESNYDNINIKKKTGVEPYPVGDWLHKGIVELTSDMFFKSLEKDVKYDIIFIDGLHTREQCLADILNSLNHLSDNGIILVHDCLPTEERQTSETDPGGAWTGTTWKSIVDIQFRNDIEVSTIDTDWGIGFIRFNKSGQMNKEEMEKLDLTWDEYVTMRNQLLNVKSVEQWINSL